MSFSIRLRDDSNLPEGKIKKDIKKHAKENHSFACFLFLKQNPRRLQKQNQHHHRCDEANHDGVHFLAAEVFAVSFHLVDDVIRGYDPADEDRSSSQTVVLSERYPAYPPEKPLAVAVKRRV